MGCDPKDAAAAGAIKVASDIISSSSLIGVGTGTTVNRFIELSGGMLKGKRVLSSSLSTALKLIDMGVDVVMYPSGGLLPEVYIDGADEVSKDGSMIKGRGGALLGEKVLAYASRTNIFIVGEDKLVDVLGSRGPLPIEVVPEAYPYVIRSLEAMGIKARPREGSGKVGPLISDWRGMIVDLYIGPITSPQELDGRLRSVPGVVETGLFIGLADYIVVGRKDCSYEVIRFRRTAGAPTI